jgi:hypothetical protein
MTDQEKLDILVKDFGKLDENRKDYVHDLIRKLAEIHCGGGFPGEYGNNGTELAEEGIGHISGLSRI